MRKRVISILLAALMVVSLLPTVALATETAGLDNFKKVQTYTDGKFTDVKSDDWFEKNVSSAYELNLMVGKRNDFFDTESNLTVAEAMTIAARLRSIYYTGKAEFEQGDPWYQAYTDYCKANGVADPADYDLNKAITRGEFAEIFAKALPADALKKINTVQDNMIPDVKNSDKFSAAIYLLYRAGVLVGNDKKGTFAPDTNIKRVEVAAITTRMAQPALRESIRLVKPSSGGGSYTPPAPTTYTVTFDMQGHGTQIDPITNVASNAKITAPTPAPTADGYIFNGWYKTKDATTGELSDPWDFDNDTVTADITLYAEWAKTVADVLATVDGFPEFDMVNLKVPANAWARDGQGKMCIYNGSLCIFRDIYYFYTKVELNTVLTKGTNTWTCTNNYGETFTFNMDESVLTSVTLSGYTGVDPEINDTYAPIKMPQKGDLITLSSDTTHQYRVLSADGTKAFVMSMYDVSGTKKAYDANGTMSEKNLLQYKDSDIDKYLEETWYAGLNSTIKGAIEATTIDQPAYERTSTDPGSGTYYAGTYDFESPEAYYIVPHSDKTAEVGERHAYLLDVKDVVDYLGAGNITPAKVNEMFFDTDSSTSKSCWLRSAYTDSISSAWNVDDYDGSLCYSSYNYTREARAAFTIDLSKVDFDIVPELYTVTFDMNGVGSAIDSQTVAKGGKVAKPADPTDSTLTFKGWYKAKDATTGALSDPWNFDTDTVTADVTLYAKWVITVGDLMAKQTNFPSTPDGSWKSDIDDNVMCYGYYYGMTALFGIGGGGDVDAQFVEDSDELTIVEGGYQYSYGGWTLTFIMDGDTITSIVHSSMGTYHPVSV